MSVKNILFLGTLVPKEIQKEVRENNIGTAQDASTGFELNIIRGLEENIEHIVTICNLLPVSGYPKYYKSPIIKRMEFSHTNGAKDVNVGFINIQYIKRLFIKGLYVKELRRILRENESFDAVIGFNSNPSIVEGFKIAKEYNDSIITCLVLGDMPEFNDLSNNKSILYNWYIKSNAKHFREMLRYIDCYGFVTEQTAFYLKTTKPYVIIEGISELYENSNSGLGNSKKTIVYTGTTNKQFGLPNLVEAFTHIHDNSMELIICGCGDYDSEISAKAKLDKRIRFLGVVPREQALEIQRNATVLVNPRQNLGEYTKYSFPIKTMEYLSSGVPVVTYKLEGIPREYDNYLLYVEDNEIETLCNKLCYVCDMSEEDRSIIGERNLQFMKTQKDAKTQSGKLIKMIDELRGKNN